MSILTGRRSALALYRHLGKCRFVFVRPYIYIYIYIYIQAANDAVFEPPMEESGHVLYISRHVRDTTRFKCRFDISMTHCDEVTLIEYLHMKSIRFIFQHLDLCRCRRLLNFHNYIIYIIWPGIRYSNSTNTIITYIIHDIYIYPEILRNNNKNELTGSRVDFSMK
jgi:hypothetical protein